MKSEQLGRASIGLFGMSVSLLVLATGCDLKFPGPKFNLNTPDASILGGFSGSAALGNFNGAAGQGAVPSVTHPPMVIVQLMSVSGVAPAEPCPAGHTAPDGSCKLRSGVAPQCPQGASMCGSGKCCAAGFSCGSSGACERAPGGASLALPAHCSVGELVTSEGSNCPVLDQSNAAELHARCCPVGATLRCTEPGNASSAVCVLESLDLPLCPPNYAQLIDTMTSETGCCPSSDGPVQLSGGQCQYLEAGAPQCSGSIDAATGACCQGALTDSGRCCALAHQACGDGCCELGESCDEGTGKCMAPEKAISPVCPNEAPRDCSSVGGQCCPDNTQCKPDGSCSCPSNTPVDCGGFCAVSTTQCSCPSDHPDACGSQCCLHGGCNGGAGSAAVCGCPADTTMCGENCCPAGASCVGGQCLGCGGDAPVLCGNNCCSIGQMCVAGQCVGSCGGDAPIQCGAACCHLGESCNGGSCVPQSAQSSSSDAQPDAGVAGAGFGPGVTSGESCKPVPVTCSACTVNACASASSSGSCRSWFEASDGKTFDCKSCGDCTTAATAAVAHCCPVHL